MLYRLQSEDREEQIHGLVCMCVYMGCMSGRKLWGLRVLRVFSPRVHIYGDFEISLILSLLLARSLLTSGPQGQQWAKAWGLLVT